MTSRAIDTFAPLSVDRAALLDDRSFAPPSASRYTQWVDANVNVFTWK